MSVTIQIRNVPDALHRKLKSRAAGAGMSPSDYLLQEVRKSAEAPTLDELRERLAKLPRVKLPESPTRALRAVRDRR
jgi:plasmid stability protein